MHRLISVPAILFLATITGQVQAAGAGGASLRLYSDICYNEEAGDVLGTRIGVLDLEDGPYALYQEADGGLEKAQIVKLDKKDIEKSKIDFSIEDGSASVRFQGSISASRITGSFDDHRFGLAGETVFHLKRVPSLHKGFPDCK